MRRETKSSVSLLLMCIAVLAPLFATIVSPNSSTGDWPMGGAGPDRRNFNEAEKTLLPPLFVKWSRDVRYEVDCVTAVGDRLFLGLGGDPNKVVCLDAADGEEIWNYSVEGSGASNDVAPAYLDGRIYFGGQTAKKLCVLNATDGSFIWGMDLAGSMYARPPAVAGGLVYVTGGQTLYVIDPTTRSVKWTAQNLAAAPAVSDGVVFAPVWTTGRPIIAFDGNTGAQKWNKTVVIFWYDLPLVSGETVFIGGRDESGPAIFALSKTDGTEKWRAHINSSLDLGGFNSGFMAEGDGVLVAVAYDASLKATEVYAFDSATGSSLWKFRVAGQTGRSHIFLTPTLANGVAYVADYFAGKVYMFQARSGTLLSEHHESGWVDTQPVVSNGTVYIVFGSKLFAFTCVTYDATVSSAEGGIMIDGAPTQGDWHSKWSKGSNHTLSVSQSSQGFLIQKVFDHWLVDGTSRAGSTMTITVTGPVQISAVWQDDYTQLILLAGGGLVLVVAAVVLLMRRAPRGLPPPP
jgi:outer membrane protein assembly factor BamB